MRDLSRMKELIGESLIEGDLINVDCYVNPRLGLFIPSVGTCGYAQRTDHTHPSYMISILFGHDHFEINPEIEVKKDQNFSMILSPDIPHSDFSEEFNHYYCVLIDREYFEEQYKMYTDEGPHFDWRQFALPGEFIKTLNLFAFEYSRNMPNAEVTLEAYSTIITHGIIRSLLGTSQAVRSVSSHYAVARIQHYIEQHYSENITVSRLADQVHMSASSLNRIFKRELNLTPIKYLIQIRIEKSKTLLRRKDISITEIAAKCGFSSSAHLAADFKRLTNLTPRQYRDTYKD